MKLDMRAQLLDVFRCVERLCETSPAALRKLVQRDSLIAAVPRTDAEPAFKVDTRELLRRLPLHVMACALAQEPRAGGGARLPQPVGKHEEHTQNAFQGYNENLMPLHVMACVLPRADSRRWGKAFTACGQA